MRLSWSKNKTTNLFFHCSKPKKIPVGFCTNCLFVFTLSIFLIKNNIFNLHSRDQSNSLHYTMKEDFKNKESIFSEKKVGRLFEHTTAWENERLKEKETRSNADTVQILMITAMLLVSCGVYGIVITVELDNENLRYSRKVSIALSIAVMIVGALIIRLALNQPAGFRRSSKMIRFGIASYLLFSCGILFEISLFNMSTVNISISIVGVIQSIILLPAILEERRIFEPLFSHGALIYICLRGFLAYDWYD